MLIVYSWYSWNHRRQYQQVIKSSMTLDQTVARLPGLQHVRVATIGQHQLFGHCYVGYNKRSLLCSTWWCNFGDCSDFGTCVPSHTSELNRHTSSASNLTALLDADPSQTYKRHRGVAVSVPSTSVI